MLSLLCGDAAGAPHGSELSFVWGTLYFQDPIDAAYFARSWTKQDRRVADDVMTLVANFAKYG